MKKTTVSIALLLALVTGCRKPNARPDVQPQRYTYEAYLKNMGIVMDKKYDLYRNGTLIAVVPLVGRVSFGADSTFTQYELDTDTTRYVKYKVAFSHTDHEPQRFTIAAVREVERINNTADSDLPLSGSMATGFEVSADVTNSRAINMRPRGWTEGTGQAYYSFSK
jgi:hypothetical protein